MGYLNRTFHPEAFQGLGRTQRYFEGWYLKCVSADQKHRWAFIPGLFLGLQGEGEAFVQVLDGSPASNGAGRPSGSAHRSWYHRFDRSAFQAEEGRFEVSVEKNRFGAQGMTLNLGELDPSGNDTGGHPGGVTGGAVRGQLTFNQGRGLTGWPVTKLSPGIMGPFGLIPFMECSHGLVSFSHELSGTLELEGKSVSFDGGKGYIEKDWGAAFPSAYVWMQSNHFSQPNVCLSASIAIIPTLPKNGLSSALDRLGQRVAGRPVSSFRGFIVGLWRDGALHTFATYNGSRTESLEIDDRHVRWTLRSADERLELRTERAAGGLLHAPVRTQMHRRVEESLDARLEVRLSKLSGEVLFEDVGVCGGLEVFGDLERLLSY